MRIAIKRIYENPQPSDGYRILVDRLWPRGVSKKDARLDEWNRDLAPSHDLRKWFGHSPERFDEFCSRYRHEVADKTHEFSRIRRIAGKGPVTLLIAVRQTELSHAHLLREILLEDQKDT